MVRKQVILVGYIGGRVGSSLVMAMLEKAGFDVGQNNRGSNENPLGFYEPESYFSFLQEKFKEFDFLNFMAKKLKGNDLRIFDDKCEEVKEEFEALLDKEFYGDKIAIKCPYYAPVRLFDMYKYDVRMISIKRGAEDQARSILKMNSASKYNQKEVVEWLNSWDHTKWLLSGYCGAYNIEFEDIIEDPEYVLTPLFKWLKPDIKNINEIIGLVDKSLPTINSIII
ncbi:MAG: hypothetical protein KAI81_07770 [Candidatus Marinimicrobia bacterium]|nr:hypothetical protein [Candidatus Neomarinimicrobiota bacterium]